MRPLTIWDDPECPDIGRFGSDRPSGPPEPDFIRARDLMDPDEIKTIRICCPEADHA